MAAIARRSPATVPLDCLPPKLGGAQPRSAEIRGHAEAKNDAVSDVSSSRSTSSSSLRAADDVHPVSVAAPVSSSSLRAADDAHPSPVSVAAHVEPVVHPSLLLPALDAPWTVRLAVVDEDAPLALRLTLTQRQRRRPLARVLDALRVAYEKRYPRLALDPSSATLRSRALRGDATVESQLHDGATVLVDRAEPVELDDDVLPPLAVRLASHGRLGRASAAEVVATFESVFDHYVARGADAFSAAQEATIKTVKAAVERECVAAAREPPAPRRRGPGRIGVYALVASHVGDADRLPRLRRLLRSLAAQDPPPARGLLSLSGGSPELLEAAVACAASSKPKWLEVLASETPLKQFEHYGRLARRVGAATDAWCVLSDDDDVWHPRRSAAYAAAARACRADVTVVVSSWLARPAYAGAAPLADAADVDAAVAAGRAATTDDGGGRKLEEYFQYAVRADVFAEFFAAAGPGALASQYGDICFYNFCRRRGTCQRFRPTCGFARNWIYFYDKPFPGAPPSPRGGGGAPRATASTAVAPDARDDADARAHAAALPGHDVDALAELFCTARSTAELYVAVFGGAPTAVSRGAFLALGEVAVRSHLAALGYGGALLAAAVAHRAAALEALAARAGLALE